MEDDDDDDDERSEWTRKKRVSVVRVKRKRGTEPSADVLFLVGEEGEMRDDDDERAKKRRHGRSRSSGKQTQKGRDGTKRDQELAAQLDAVLGGGSQALPSYRQNQMERQQQETKTKTVTPLGTRKNVLRKFVRLTREAVEQKDARDAEKVKNIAGEQKGRRGEGGGGGAGGAASSRVEEGSIAAAAKKNTARKATKRTYEEVKVMGDEENTKNWKREHAEEQKKKKCSNDGIEDDAFECY